MRYVIRTLSSPPRYGQIVNGLLRGWTLRLPDATTFPTREAARDAGPYASVLYSNEAYEIVSLVGIATERLLQSADAMGPL